VCLFTSRLFLLAVQHSSQELLHMGDKRRFHAFADFICQTFPASKTIADVAGGRGELAFRLFEYGKQPAIIDPRSTTFPRWIHQSLRKQTLCTGKRQCIERRQARVEDVDLQVFDLIVALHPDEATEPVIRTAIASGIAFAVVPCCVFPLDRISRTQEEWICYLEHLAPGIQRGILSIAGANSVLWWNPAQAE
jgi:hypothetical protein